MSDSGINNIKIDFSPGRHYVGVTLGSRVPDEREIKEFQYDTGIKKVH